MVVRAERAGSKGSSFDDVFEPQVEGVRIGQETHRHLTTKFSASPVNRNRRDNSSEENEQYEKLDPSPTGYRDYTPPAELIKNRYDPTGSSSLSKQRNDNDRLAFGNSDTPQHTIDESFTHKVRLSLNFSYKTFTISVVFHAYPDKFCNRPLTEILTWVPISYFLTDF